MSNNPQNKPATAEQAVELGLKKEEFTHICEILGRTPNIDEYKQAVVGIDLTKFKPPKKNSLEALSAHY